MSNAKKIYVRVNPRMGRTRFFRAGIEFDSNWQAVTVDDATVSTLSAEQMLELSDIDPNVQEIELVVVEADPDPKQVAEISDIDPNVQEIEPVAVEADPEPDTKPLLKKAAKK